MFCKMPCIIHQLPQEQAGWWGWGRGVCRQPPALPPAMRAPPPPRPSLGFPQGFPSLLVPGHWQLLWGSPSPGLSPIPRTSATPTHLRRLSSLRCGIYLNVSLILHPPPRGGIKFTEKQEKQSRAKLVITIKPRENQSRDTQFETLSFPFFEVALFFLFLLL